MEFKEKITAHQEGKYDFTRELIDLALFHDFKTTMVMSLYQQPFIHYTEEEEEVETLMLPRWRPQYEEGKTYEQKLARNFKIWIARYTKSANSIRNKQLFEGTQLELMEGQDPLHLIYSTFAKLGYHYYKDDFDKVPSRVWKDMEERYDFDYMDGVRAEFNEFLRPLPAINREKQKLTDQYIPLVEEALNEVLPKVDLNKKETEIIGFIAIGTKRKVDRKLTKLIGTKVHQIDGEKYYVTLKDIRKNGFNKTKPNDILQVNERKLSPNQSIFFGTLKKHIQKEIDGINIEPFTFDAEGKPIEINKRYFALKMDMEESAFKHRLRRIQAK